MSELRTFLRYEGRTIEVDGALVIGRSSGCDLVLDDELSSRRHCRIEVRGERVVLVDLDSRNGVLVNGARVVGERELHHGEVIAIGGARLIVRRQARAPREQHASHASTQPDAPDDAGAWRSVLGALASGAEAALACGDRARAEAGARSLFDSARTVCARTGSLEKEMIERATELGLALAERGGDAYWLDRVIALHLHARLPLAREAALRLARAPAPLAPVVDDYVAASARIEGLSREARQQLALIGYLREAASRRVQPGDGAAPVDALRSAVLARTALTPAPASGDGSQEAVDPWRLLAEGGWLMLDQFDEGGRRYVVACRRVPRASRAESLTVQERRVAALLARGEANKLIGYQLGLSRSRAANIVRAIKRKLGVGSRSEAVMVLRWASVRD